MSNLDIINIIIPAASGLIGALFGAIATSKATNKSVNASKELAEKAAERTAKAELKAIIEEIEMPLLETLKELFNQPSSINVSLSASIATHLIFKARHRTDDPELEKKLVYLLGAIAWAQSMFVILDQGANSLSKPRVWSRVHEAYGNLQSYVFGEANYDLQNFINAGGAGEDLPSITELKKKRSD